MPKWNTKEIVWVLAAALGLALLMTYPLPAGITHLGRLDTGDGMQSLWNIAWVAHALTTRPGRVFDANIFYPHRNTLAWLEANLGAGALAIPAWLATGNPYFAYNVVVLIGFCLSALAMYGLARYLTASRPAAAVAGIAFAYCPYIFARIPHIQLQMTFVLPLSLWAFHRFVDKQTFGQASVLGLTVALAAVFCGYFGVFAGLTIGLATMTYAVVGGYWRSPRYWTLTGWAALLSVGLVLPLFMPYLRLQQETGFERPLAEAQMFSANWQSYLTSSAWAHRWLLVLVRGWKEVLFPGFVATILGLSGARLALARRSGRTEERASSIRAAAIFYLLLALLAFWSSFGPDGGLYTVFHYTIPIFSFMHAPGRFGLLVVLALVVLSAFSVEWIARRRYGRLVAVGLAVVTVAELITIPLRLEEAEPVAMPYRILAHERRGAVAEFPFFYLRGDYPRHAYYMLNSTFHWQPLINGYTDHIPADFRHDATDISTFPSRAAFRLLQERRARYVVFHLNFYDQRNLEKLYTRLEQYKEFLRPMWTEGDVWLYEIIAWPPFGT